MSVSPRSSRQPIRIFGPKHLRMTSEPDFQHISFAVRDALAASRHLIGDHGAIPVAGEVLPDFRYVLLHSGGIDGHYVEYMEPLGNGFLARFLRKHGEGPHHLTWMVPDLESSVAAVRELGFDVVGEDYGHAAWEEAFIAPHPATGCIIQLARSDDDYPTWEDLRSGTADLSRLPFSRHGSDRSWWTSLRDIPRSEPSSSAQITVRSIDAPLIRRLFVDVLGADADGAEYHWPNGDVILEQGGESGISRAQPLR